MRVAVIQSCYIPWRGYFDVIDSVDTFVIYDDVQYSSGSWRNRNKVKTPRGAKWLSVPVQASLGASIDETPIGKPHKPWRDEHRRLLNESLGSAPYFADAMRLWEEGVRPEDRFLTELNLRLIRLVCEYLAIRTPLVLSRDYALQGSKTARLVELLTKVGATAYLSGPSAKGYIENRQFRDAGIGLAYKTYDYAPYPQGWGEFEGAVSALDLIANCGPRSRDYLKSRTPDEVVDLG